MTFQLVFLENFVLGQFLAVSNQALVNETVIFSQYLIIETFVTLSQLVHFCAREIKTTRQFREKNRHCGIREMSPKIVRDAQQAHLAACNITT